MSSCKAVGGLELQCYDTCQTGIRNGFFVLYLCSAVERAGSLFVRLHDGLSLTTTVVIN